MQNEVIIFFILFKKFIGLLKLFQKVATSFAGPSFWLYTRRNPDSKIILNDRSLSSTSFKLGAMTRLIIPGFTDSGNNPWVISIKNNLLKISDDNVIVVDWSDGAKLVPPGIYFEAAKNTKIVGSVTATFLKKMEINVLKTHCIGHSLGAHCCGFIGQESQLQRISGLDPAGPLFYAFLNKDLEQWRLNKNHALFVDVIHTDVNRFGLRFELGHQDFWPNLNGISDKQPGCSVFSLDISCSHNRAPLYYAESILSNSKFPTSVDLKCGGRIHADSNANNCYYTQIYPKMGYYANKDLGTGNFYLPTNAEPPFSIVNDQIIYKNVRLSDHFYYTSLLKTSDACWKLCSDHPICAATTFYGPNNCFLYIEGFKFSKQLDWTSNSLFKIDLTTPNVYANLRLANHYYYTRASISDCWKRCTSESQCNAITFHDTNNCYLYAAGFKFTKENGWTSYSLYSITF